MTEMYKTFTSFFDEIFSDSNRLINYLEQNQPARFNKQMSSSQFPPSDILCNTKTKDLTIKVALAGYSEDNISLAFDGDYLRLLVDRCLKDDENAIPEYIIQKGIKLPQHVEASWFIDPRYYSREEVNVSFKDGLLTIGITPREEIKPKNVRLFGKLPEIENKKE